MSGARRDPEDSRHTVRDPEGAAHRRAARDPERAVDRRAAHRRAARPLWLRITLQSLPVLLGTMVVGILAGQLLAYFQDRLLAIPVLLAIVPAVNGIGGNVGSILGSRVASGLHFGGLWSNRARGFRRDVAAAVLLAVLSFAFLGLLAAYGAPFLGLAAPVRVLPLLATALMTGLLLVMVMVLLVIVVGVLSHRHGWDPDNVVIPVLTTAVDTLGIVFLLLSAMVIGL